MEPIKTYSDGTPYTKTCTRCGISKIAEQEFHKSNSTMDGWHSRCRKCRKEAYQESLKRQEGIQPGDLTLSRTFRAKNAGNRKLKRCPECDTIKPVSQFYKNKGRSDGLTSYCKPCVNAYNRTGLRSSQRGEILKEELREAQIEHRKYQLLHERFPEDSWYAIAYEIRKKRLDRAKHRLSHYQKHGEVPKRPTDVDERHPMQRRKEYEERMMSFYEQSRQESEQRRRASQTDDP